MTSPQVVLYRSPSNTYNECPKCHGSKDNRAEYCRGCTYPRSEVKQPEDRSISYIPLTRGQFAIVDSEDFERISAWSWRANLTSEGKFYAQSTQHRNGKRVDLMMHRVIMGLEKGDHREVDHIDPSSPLDNRKSNLRLSTHQENIRNRPAQKNNKSGFKGVVQVKPNKWVATIGHNRKKVHLGTFNSPQEAYTAYCEAANRLHGAFANVA